MRFGLVAVGAPLIIAGLAFEAVYMSNSQISFAGTSISENTWLVTGLVFVFGGLLLALAGLKISKARKVQS